MRVDGRDRRWSAGAHRAALAVAVGKSPVLPRTHDRQPIAGRGGTQVVALVHRDVEIAACGVECQPDGRADAAGLDLRIAPVREEAEDGRGVGRRRLARVARRRDTQPEPAVRPERELVDLADARGQREDGSGRREPRSVEAAIGGHAVLRRHVERAVQPEQA